MKKDASNNSSTVAYVFVATVNIFTEPLPNNDKRLHIKTHRLMEGIYEASR
jgi:hypothetical protein